MAAKFCEVGKVGGKTMKKYYHPKVSALRKVKSPMKNCRDCKYSKHPDWDILMPSFICCTHPEGEEIGRIDVLRRSDRYCGPEAKWFAGRVS